MSHLKEWSTRLLKVNLDSVPLLAETRPASGMVHHVAILKIGKYVLSAVTKIGEKAITAIFIDHAETTNVQYVIQLFGTMNVLNF